MEKYYSNICIQLLKRVTGAIEPAFKNATGAFNQFNRTDIQHFQRKIHEKKTKNL
jgi:hypothetical protein